MFEEFRINIQELFNWSDVKFDQFTTLWERELYNNISKSREPLFYDKEYMHNLVSLFFIMLQQDLNLHRIYDNPKPLFLALVCFYLVNDLKLQIQTKESLVKLYQFFAILEIESLVTRKTFEDSFTILSLFEQSLDPIYSDTITTKDSLMLKDLLLFTDPIIVLGKACMIFNGDPSKVRFKYEAKDKTELSSNLFFDKTFKISQKIDNTFIKQIYSDRLHKLMMFQGSKKVFPF